MNEQQESKKLNNVIFFYGHHQQDPHVIDASCLSQWYPCLFKSEETVFTSAEQYMMATKAFYFDDHEMYRKIMFTTHPAMINKYGRMVKNFDEERWLDIREDVIHNANLLKFSQNDKLKEFLLNTGDAIIAKASPWDRIYGIGLAADNPDVYYYERWRGSNLLGIALMKVREHFRNARQPYGG